MLCSILKAHPDMCLLVVGVSSVCVCVCLCSAHHVQEFMSFIKGSAEAVSSPSGHLSLQE